MAAAKNSISLGDRRVGSRFPVDANVYFSDASGYGPLMHGRIVERSSGGLTLLAYTPARPGVELDIELQPGPNAAVAGVQLVKGRVKHLNGDAEQGYRIGVALAFKRPKPRPAKKSAPTSLEPSFNSLRPEARATSAPAVQEPPENTSSHSRARLIALGIAAILCAIFFLMNVRDAARLGEIPNADGNSFLLEGEETLGADRLASLSSPWPSTGSGGLSEYEPQESEEALLRIPEYSEALTRPIDEERLALFAAPPIDGAVPGSLDTLDDLNTPSVDPLAKALDLARRAVDASEIGNDIAAQALSTQALRLASDLPESWAEILQATRNSITAATPRRTPWPSFNNWVGLGPQLDSVPANAPVVVYVDTSNFTLTVVRDAQPVMQFPVGLGVAGSTPKGIFAIGNKIIEPTWYNSGDPVAAKDPANPLGDRWMGLNAGDHPLVYGIHPTDLPESIGDALSAGCIRMRPSDARTLYAMIPLGTPVVIGPGPATAKL